MNATAAHVMLQAHQSSNHVTGWAVLAVIAGVVLTLIVIAALILWLVRGEGPDDTDSGGGGGGGGRGPDLPPSGPLWWPEFERGFRDYVAARERRQPAR